MFVFWTFNIFLTIEHILTHYLDHLIPSQGYFWILLFVEMIHLCCSVIAGLNIIGNIPGIFSKKPRKSWDFVSPKKVGTPHSVYLKKSNVSLSRYRAEVVTINLDATVLVRYIDYGNTEELHATSLKKLETELILVSIKVNFLFLKKKTNKNSRNTTKLLKWLFCVYCCFCVQF